LAGIDGEAGMRVSVGAWAWIDKSELSVSALLALKQKLTVVPRKAPGFEDDEYRGPIFLYKEEETRIGLAREYFLQNRKPEHDVVYETTEGDKSSWPGPLHFATSRQLRVEQQQALDTVSNEFCSKGGMGGIVKAPCGWGKTAYACSLIEKLQVPTLVIVHKEFLMSQWMERIAEFLPGAKVGIVQQRRCEYKGNHIVIGMVHSLASGDYPKEFYSWPGLLIFDEVHRIGARTWAPVPPLFSAKYRLGLSATPRRKDGAENVFRYHLGPVLFHAKEQRLKPVIKRVYTKFRLVKTPNFNPSLAPESLILRFLCANEQRNRRIVELAVEAVKAGRKLLVLSKRINHLNRLEADFHREWQEGRNGKAVKTGYYIGGMTEEQRFDASFAQVIFATAQFAAEGLDVPALDTLFLVSPISDVEQAVGRILRPYEGKKGPIVVDFRDDLVRMFETMGERRDQLYARIC
jgi:superfamily II DNA or RNA helicase